MSKKHQAHKRIHAKDLTSSAKPLFEENRHNAGWLAAKLGEFSSFRGDDLTITQRNAIDDFHKNHIYDLRDTVKKHGVRELLEPYFYLFDAIFFFGSLTGRVSVQYDNRSARDVGMDGEVIQEGAGAKFGIIPKPLPQKDKKYSIILYSISHYYPTRYQALRSYLGTLLHEMLHAFFELWACNQGSCAENWESKGYGHGCAWQDAALAIEENVRDEGLLNLDLRLGREDSLALEVVTAGARLRGRNLERWKMERGRVEDAVREFERRGFRGSKEVREATLLSSLKAGSIVIFGKGGMSR